MNQDITHVALDDSKRKVVVAILRPGQTQPEQREMPKEPPLIQRVFQRAWPAPAQVTGPRPRSPAISTRIWNWTRRS
jgi:hypothetical protein